ncbi:MAG: glycosyltransferase family 39 protein, partial [Planctomycetes bacterium]|nr:glycosyltransferase family 39 protein [Planctomycetota bacterium]
PATTPSGDAMAPAPAPSPAPAPAHSPAPAVPPPARWERADGAWLLGLAALCALLYLTGLSGQPMDNRGEPREGVLAQEILRSGDWLLPRPNGTRWPEKPLLFPWLCALSSLALGGDVTEFAIRLPSALMATLGVFVVYLLGRRLGMGRGGAGAAALLLAGAVTWISLGRRARIDMTLAVLIELALYALLRAYQDPARRGAWGLAAAIPLALATLAKGPMGVAFPLASLAAWFGLRALLDRTPAAPSPASSESPMPFAAALRREGAVFLAMRPCSAALAFLLLIGAWYLPASLEGGPEFRYVNLFKENIGMLLGLEEGGGHEHPVWWYLPYLFLTFLPGSIWLLPALADAARRARATPAPEVLFAPAWALACFGGLSAASGKRPDYLVLLLPALALLTGDWLARAVAAPTVHRRGLALPLFVLGLAAFVGVAAAAFTQRIEPGPKGYDLLFFGLDALPVRSRKTGVGALLDAHRGALVVAFAALGVVGLAAARFFARGRPRPALALAGGAAGAALLAGALVFYPEARNSLTIEPFVREVATYVDPDPAAFDLLHCENFTYAIPFFLDRRVPPITQANTRYWLRAGGRRFVVMTDETYAGLRADLGPETAVLLECATAVDQGRYLLLGPPGTHPVHPRRDPE